MTTTLLLVELPDSPAGLAGAITDIVTDMTISMGEKLLLVECLFVHDSTPSEPDESLAGESEALASEAEAAVARPRPVPGSRDVSRSRPASPRRWAEASFMST